MQQAIRHAKRQARQTLSSVQQEQYSQAITTRFLNSQWYQQAQTIAAYLPSKEEVNVSPIIAQAWADNKVVYLPVVTDKSHPLLFARYLPNSPMTRNVLDMRVPDSNVLIDTHGLDIVITPLVAFDRRGNRIGMGGGFYDRTFAFKNPSTTRQTLRDALPTKPLLIGAAFGIQAVDSGIDNHAWDIPLDAVITEADTFSFC